MYDTAFQHFYRRLSDRRRISEDMNPDLKLVTARWALPIAEPAIKDAALVIDATRIKLVCKRAELGNHFSENELRELKWTARDYGNSVLMPGLINLHTHLEYSLLHELYLESSESMFDWLPRLVKASWSWAPERWKKSILYGAAQSLAAGTTCVVDNSFTGQSARVLAGMGVRAIVGLELFGQDETLAEVAWKRWQEKFNSIRYDADPLLQSAIDEGVLRITVAPHSPYTVAPALWKKAASWADSNKQLVLAHVSESIEECAWIREGNETVDRYLRWMRELQLQAGISAYKDAEAPPTPWRGKGRSPCQLLADHDLLNDRLVATHMVQVDEKDMRLLKVGKVRIVHCPRSNEHLGHGVAPLKSYKNIGASIGLGTDSLASAPDLSMLHEAKAAMRVHADALDSYQMDPQEALRLATLRAAKVIGMQDKIGSLENGKLADLAVFQYGAEIAITVPEETLFNELAQSVDVYVQGKLISA